MPETLNATTEPNEFERQAQYEVDRVIVDQVNSVSNLEAVKTVENDTSDSEGTASLAAHLNIGSAGGTIEHSVISGQKIDEPEPSRQIVTEPDLPEAKMDAVIPPDATPFIPKPEVPAEAPAVLETSKDTTQNFFPPNSL